MGKIAVFRRINFAWVLGLRARSGVAALAAALALLPLAGSALAHSNEYLETIKGPNGGQVRMAEMFHFEVVVKDGEFRVWVTDHGDQPISTAGANGMATLLRGADKVTVNLAPDGDNRLVARDRGIKSGQDVRISLTVTMKGQKALHARYAPSSGHTETARH